MRALVLFPLARTWALCPSARRVAMATRYKSKALVSVHETALGMTEAGVMSKRTRRAFDEMCLTPVEKMSPGETRTLRIRDKPEERA